MSGRLRYSNVFLESARTIAALAEPRTGITECLCLTKMTVMETWGIVDCR